jgi:hypothetical protein
MRKSFLCALLFSFLIASCHQSKKESVKVYHSHYISDSLNRASDSILLATAVYPIEDKLHLRADEFFDDFIFDFSRLKKVQLERTVFPLLSIHNNDTTWMNQEQWKNNVLFLNQDFYTVFFENEEQMEYEKRSDLEHVDVECIILDSMLLHTYHFERMEKAWRLIQEDKQSLKDVNLQDFFSFYNRFVTDDAFQKKSISFPLHYATTDSDEESGYIDGTLDYEQWQIFKPQLPTGMITNIRYGQSYGKNKKMIMIKRGIANGLMEVLTFKKANGKWKLIKFEN